eukprot:CAMPEP_0206386850 /NCGR_PEP_ID=MMETSP0294-20121207/16215_1 /ASSEMBLY_ACC=CAM_ASM_000327 /TAXON_ID=39354 /ORGANISM="Heterosigma akashiwo, Strain CCMP2393" /LENGTH=377 /DNA_ID=CAMNT_0053838029 /DNA_START=280 /DNA_END=1413 /DNA_ORIENTATION=-
MVLPFILRREKATVLDDLPPKIISDVWCEMSSAQHEIYRSLLQRFSSNVSPEDSKKKPKETLNLLRLLMLTCVHPWIVMEIVDQDFRVPNHSDEGLEMSGKLLALRDLLWECGIGHQDYNMGSTKEEVEEEEWEEQTSQIPDQHRCLIFAQHRSALAAVERHLLARRLPSVGHLRLDGATPPGDRQALVDRFNEDESISLLLLTTKVGGLGLNLTGADTVIFLEHDWNPQNDLQAMDRVHRIGQKRSVNVYRIITKGSIEEKISSTQKFKLEVSKRVINEDNEDIATDQADTGLWEILEHFQVSAELQRVNNLDSAVSHSQQLVAGKLGLCTTAVLDDSAVEEARMTGAIMFGGGADHMLADSKSKEDVEYQDLGII